jgi:hypothetical protein
MGFRFCRTIGTFILSGCARALLDYAETLRGTTDGLIAVIGFD